LVDKEKIDIPTFSDLPSEKMMNNIYLQYIQLWLYIYELTTEYKKEMEMAEPQSVCEWLDIKLDRIPPQKKINLIGEICDELTAQQLRQVEELVNQKRLEKLEDAKEQVIAEMREKFAQLDLDFEEVMGMRRSRHRGSILPPRYQSPTGQTWSGRGFPPHWIREYEDAGGNREDYLIKDEG
jgi:DNA-binding protein H-NS